jgi:hypothetical protein
MAQTDLTFIDECGSIFVHFLMPFESLSLALFCVFGMRPRRSRHARLSFRYGVLFVSLMVQQSHTPTLCVAKCAIEWAETFGSPLDSALAAGLEM